MGNSFSGFYPESLDYFESLAANNNKVWFEDHRNDFEQYLMEPLKSLVNDLSGAMLAIDPELVTIPAVDKTISCIYRDTRFSRNKSPYKTCLWITFKRRSPDRSPKKRERSGDMEYILKKREVMSLTTAVRHLIRVNEGFVWLTGSEDPRDYVLSRGDRFDMGGKGTLVLEALTDSAFCIGCLHAVPVQVTIPINPQQCLFKA